MRQLLLVAVIAACTPQLEAQTPRPRRMGSTPRAAKRALEAQLVWPVCEVPQRPGKACGLWCESQDFVRVFEKAMATKCPGQTGDTATPECWRAVNAIIDAALADRYPLAKMREIDQFCAASPKECESAAQFELVWLKSHNGAAFASYRIELAKIEDDDEREAQWEREDTKRQERNAIAAQDARERNQRIANAIGAMGASMQAATNASTSRQTCSSDYNCGEYGICVKRQSAAIGFCAGH